MSSDNKFRPPERSRRVRRPEDQDRQSPGGSSGGRRDPRRRTSYVPRQGSGRAIQPPGSRSTGQGDTHGAGRDQGRPLRASPPRPRNEADSPYDGPESEQDDELIDVGSGYTPRPDRRQPRQRGVGARRSRRLDVGLDDEADTDNTYGDRYDDSFIDEDDWYEEEAAAGAYRPRSRSSNRGSGSRRRRPAISRPTIPRPVMPARIKDAALVQDNRALVMLGALIASTVAMVFVTMNRVDRLAPGFATHVSASGLAESIQSESVLWELPLMSGALLLMNAVAAWFFSPQSRFSARFLLANSVLVQLLIWVALLRIAY